MAETASGREALKRVDEGSLGWTLKGRFRYRSKHRAQDMALVQELWPIPGLKEVVHIDDAPTRIQKKWKRGFKPHRTQFVKLVKEVRENYRELLDILDSHPACSDSLSAEGRSFAERVKEEVLQPSAKLISFVTNILPSLGEKHLCDVRDEDIRGLSQGNKGFMSLSKNSPISVLLSYLYNVRGMCLSVNGDCDEAMREFDQALTMFPPVKNVPCKTEILIRFDRARTLCELGRYEEALGDFRVCAASVRLLMYHDFFEPARADEDFRNRVNIEVVLVSLQIKKQRKKPRPFFKPQELDVLYKELGIGPYSEPNYKCFHCETSRLETKLISCPKCQNIWFCNQDCLNASWKEHKRSCRLKTEIMCKETYDCTHAKVLGEDHSFFVVPKYPDENGVSFYCYDYEKDEVFNALTDKVVIPYKETDDESLQKSETFVEGEANKENEPPAAS